MTPPDRKELRLPPPLYAEVVRTLTHDIRAKYRVGDVIAVCEAGTGRELHVHISCLKRAPAEGGAAECGLTVLPVDIRWNLLALLAKEEQGLFRNWLYDLMKRVEDQVGEAFVLEQAD